MELQLRLIILAIGLLIIGLIYWLGTRRQRRRGGAVKTGRRGKAKRGAANPYDNHDPLLKELEVNESVDLSLNEPVAVGAKQPPPPRRADLPAPTGEPIHTPQADGAGGPRAPMDAPDVVIRAAPPASLSSPEPKAEVNATAAYPDDPPAGIDPAPPAAESAPGVSATPSVPDPVNVVLVIKAAEGQQFRGPDLLTTLRDRGYRFNAKKTWDHLIPGQEQPIFSVGHIIEPGTFDLGDMEHFSTPGLLLFMNLPGPLPAARAVDVLLDAAIELAQSLGGSVCDDNGRALSLELQNNLRLEATEYERQYRVAGGIA